MTRTPEGKVADDDSRERTVTVKSFEASRAERIGAPMLPEP
jgi:hypothetical protein